MGYVVRVDPDQVAAAAAALDAVVVELEQVARGSARAWQRAALAAGGRELAGACTTAGEQGSRLTAGAATLAGQLADATRAAAEAYREVEVLVARTWTGAGDGSGTGRSS
jgi:hypothetical protein